MSNLADRAIQVEKLIYRYLPKADGYNDIVVEAMNYTMSTGGKRLRPMLMEETYKLFGGTEDVIYPFMAAIEMIHTYSLIHDDLPALDNDDYRRGRKTAHIVYGEAMAILAGDGLLNYAYEVASSAYEGREEDVCIGRAIRILAKLPGIYGMIGGQTADVYLTGTKLNAEQLDYIYRNKTGALIEAAMTIGAVLAGASSEHIELIKQVANNVGLSFQIQDDILDVIGDENTIGKPIHSDMDNDKITYVTIHGIDESKKTVESLSKEAVEALEQLPYNNPLLDEIIMSLIDRNK